MIALLKLSVIILFYGLCETVIGQETFVRPARCDKDVSLDSGLLRTKLVASLSTCVMECLGETRCLSLNYEQGHENSTETRTCELNSVRADSLGSNLEFRVGYNYYEKTPALDYNATSCTQYVGYRDCTEVYDNGNDWSGSYHVHVPEEGVKPQVVYCDMYQKPGIIVLRRVDRSVLFDRTWAQYKQEFGNLETNYWIGLEMLHQITKNGNYELRIDVQHKTNNHWYYARYTTFYIDGEDSHYMLHVGGYSGNGGDRLSYHNNMKFTTKDRDYDKYGPKNCAAHQGDNGGWWYNACYYSRPTTTHQNIFWAWPIKTFVMRLIRKTAS